MESEKDDGVRRAAKQRVSTAVQERKRKRARVVAARSLSADRPTRAWSLLLPPTFPAERK